MQGKVPRRFSTLVCTTHPARYPPKSGNWLWPAETGRRPGTRHRPGEQGAEGLPSEKATGQGSSSLTGLGVGFWSCPSRFPSHTGPLTLPSTPVSHFCFALCIRKRVELANTKVQIPNVIVTGQGNRVEAWGHFVSPPLPPLYPPRAARASG